MRVVVATFERFDTTCQQFGEKFKLLENDSESDWILKDAYEKGIFIKKTNLEVLKYVHFPGNEPEFVLVRRTLMKNFDIKQLKTVYNMGKNNAGPKVFGCQHGKENNSKDVYIYVVKEPFFRVLEFASTRAFIRTTNRSQVLKLYADIFSDLNVLHHMGQSGQIHNNVSPLTLFTDPHITNTYLSGYNLMQTQAERIQDAGVPLVMPPTRFDKSLHPSMQDDWYSTALLIANLESEKGYDDVFTADASAGEFTPISLECLKGTWTEECKNQLAENVKRILQNAGYGNFIEDANLLEHENQINLTTLLAHLVRHDDNMSEQRVMETMKNEIENFERVEQEGIEIPRMEDAEEKSKLQKEFEDSANDLNDILEEMNIFLRELTEGKAIPSPDPRIELSERIVSLMNREVSGFKETKLFGACPELFFRRKTKANVRGNYEGDALPSSLEGVYESEKEVESMIQSSIKSSSGKKITESEIQNKLAEHLVSGMKSKNESKLSSSIKKGVEESIKTSSNSKMTSSQTKSKQVDESVIKSSLKKGIESSSKSSLLKVSQKPEISSLKKSVSSNIQKSNASSSKKLNVSSVSSKNKILV